MNKRGDKCPPAVRAGLTRGRSSNELFTALYDDHFDQRPTLFKQAFGSAEKRGSGGLLIGPLQLHLIRLIIHSLS